MKSLVSLAGSLALCAIASSSAWAAVLFLEPADSTTTPGGSVSIDVMISGLGAGSPPSVGAFDLTLAYEPELLQLTGAGFGALLGDPDLEAVTSIVPSAGSINLAEISLLDPAVLDALQGSSFSLATLTFQAIGPGTAHLAFADALVGDAFGSVVPIDAFRGATIAVGTTSPIPEPNTRPLYLIGAAVALVYIAKSGGQRAMK